MAGYGDINEIVRHCSGLTSSIVFFHWFLPLYLREWSLCLIFNSSALFVYSYGLSYFLTCTRLTQSFSSVEFGNSLRSSFPFLSLLFVALCLLKRVPDNRQKTPRSYLGAIEDKLRLRNDDIIEDAPSRSGPRAESRSWSSGSPRSGSPPCSAAATRVIPTIRLRTRVGPWSRWWCSGPIFTTVSLDSALNLKW